MAYTKPHAAITATATSAQILVPKRLVPGNRVRLRILTAAGTYTSNNKWVLTITPRVNEVRSDGTADSTYATSVQAEHTLTLGDGGANGAGTFYWDFPCLRDFKIVATKTGSPGALTVEVLTPDVPVGC